MKTDKKQTKIKVQLIYHYSVEDEDCGGDYCSVDVMVDGKKVIGYGDYYHDKGAETAGGFIDGLKFVYGEKNVEVLEEKNINDSDL